MSNKIMLETIKKWFRKNGWELYQENQYFLGYKKLDVEEELSYILPKNLTEKDKDDFIIFITDNL